MAQATLGIVCIDDEARLVVSAAIREQRPVHFANNRGPYVDVICGDSTESRVYGRIERRSSHQTAHLLASCSAPGAGAVDPPTASCGRPQHMDMCAEKCTGDSRRPTLTKHYHVVRSVEFTLFVASSAVLLSSPSTAALLTSAVEAEDSAATQLEVEAVVRYAQCLDERGPQEVGVYRDDSYEYIQFSA